MMSTTTPSHFVRFAPPRSFVKIALDGKESVDGLRRKRRRRSANCGVAEDAHKATHTTAAAPPPAAAMVVLCDGSEQQLKQQRQQLKQQERLVDVVL